MPVSLSTFVSIPIPHPWSKLLLDKLIVAHLRYFPRLLYNGYVVDAFKETGIVPILSHRITVALFKNHFIIFSPAIAVYSVW
jgi:hypothetical protein